MDLYKYIDLAALTSTVDNQFDDLYKYHDPLSDIPAYKQEIVSQLEALAGDPAKPLRHTIIKILININEAVMVLKDRALDEEGNEIEVSAEEVIAICAANNLLNVFHYFNEHNNAPSSLIRAQCVNSKAFALQDEADIHARTLSSTGILAIAEKQEEERLAAEQAAQDAADLAAAKSHASHLEIDEVDVPEEIHNPANDVLLVW